MRPIVTQLEIILAWAEWLLANLCETCTGFEYLEIEYCTYFCLPITNTWYVLFHVSCRHGISSSVSTLLQVFTTGGSETSWDLPDRHDEICRLHDGYRHYTEGSIGRRERWVSIEKLECQSLIVYVPVVLFCGLWLWIDNHSINIRDLWTSLRYC